jgi:C4-dicarboxylate-specific signal transduction histidine kinase
VAAIVSRQQAYAKSSSAERCALGELMDDALLLARNSHHQRSVEVVKAFAPAPDVYVDRHRVLQILVNLITNALQALNDSERPDKRLVAHIGVTSEQFVRLAIEDNGVGIAPEHAARLFQHGFTTRPNGHGFGLHNSALTAQELGGVLRFESPGRGLGATFILELPMTRSGLWESIPSRPRSSLRAGSTSNAQEP